MANYVFLKLTQGYQMATVGTPIEEFIKEEMTRNEIAEDLNGLYAIINDECQVNSSDYRCYVTSSEKLIIDHTLFYANRC